MAVVVQLLALFQKVELDPIVETRHFPTLDFTCSANDRFNQGIRRSLQGKALKSRAQTCKDVLKTAGVHLVVVAGVKPEPHHLQVLKEGVLGWINT